MKRNIFLTFSSKDIDQNGEQTARDIISLLDKSNSFQISNRWFEEKERHNSFEIYEKGVKALLNSDLILAEVSTPSTGVGQQIAFGMFYKIPVLVLAKEEFKEATRSLFLKGTRSTHVSFYYYKNMGDLKDNLLPLIKSKLKDKYEKLNFMATKLMKKFLFEESKKCGISQSELLRQIVNEWRSLKTR